MEDDDEYLSAEREYRGTMYKDRIVPEEAALSFSDPRSWKSFGIGFRLVYATETRGGRRGGDYYDEASWVHRNASTEGEYAGRGGMPGIRLARDFVW